MKKALLKMVFVIAIAFTMTSCYSYTIQVGKGAQTGRTVTAKNHYLISGLAPIKMADAKEMADGAEDYTVTVEHSFIDGLLTAITYGVYAPTTVTVQK